MMECICIHAENVSTVLGTLTNCAETRRIHDPIPSKQVHVFRVRQGKRKIALARSVVNAFSQTDATLFMAAVVRATQVLRVGCPCTFTS